MGVGVFTNVPGPEYVEEELEYSVPEMIENLEEWKRFNTLTEEGLLQKGLIPIWLKNFWWQKVDISNQVYFNRDINGNFGYTRNIDIKKDVIRIMGTANELFPYEKENRYLDDKMIKLFKDNKVHPFLLFINKCFVPWSKIRIVKVDEFVTFIIDRYRKLPVDSLTILHIPFAIEYNERGIGSCYPTIFRFDRDGKYSDRGDIIITSLDENVIRFEFNENRYWKFNNDSLSSDHIPYDFNLTSDNLIAFNTDGTIFNDEYPESSTKVMSMFSIENGTDVPRKVLLFYSIESNRDESIVLRSNNKDWACQIARDDPNAVINDPINPIDGDLINTRFDYTHDRLKTYQDNLRNSIDYVFNSDHNKFDEIFERLKPLSIRCYQYRDLPITIEPDGTKTISIPRDNVEWFNYKVYQILFFDGYANSDINNSITYTPSHIKFIIPNRFTFEELEVVYIRHCMNGKFDITAAPSGNIDITNCWIPEDELVVLTDCGDGTRNLAPINHTTVGINTIHIDPAYASTKLYVCNRFQFAHKKFIMKNNEIILPYDEFETCYNKYKYMIFYDGKYLNPSDYTIILPVGEQRKNIDVPRIIFGFKPGPSRVIDVYYVSSLPFGNVNNIHKKFILYCLKRRIEEKNQAKIKVPYPFKNYPRDYDSFFVIKDSIYVDKERYIIDGDYIELTDPVDFAAWIGQDIVFVFPYYINDWDTIDDPPLPADSYLDFKNHQVTVATDTSRVTFPTYTIRTANEATMLFFNSTYIDKSRYNLSGNTITMIGETILSGTTVTLVVEVDNKKIYVPGTNNIELTYYRVTPSMPNQLRFMIPELSNYDSMLIFKGSVLFDECRYKVVGNSIYILNPSDALNSSESLTFVFAHSKLDTGAITDLHVHLDFAHYRFPATTNTFTMTLDPSSKFRLSNENCMLFVNSTYISPDRYSVSGGTFTLLDPDDKFLKGKLALVVYGYEKLPDPDPELMEGDLNDIIYFTERKTISVTRQVTYNIPYMTAGSKVYTDFPFFVTSGGGRFIPEIHYTVNKSAGTITFLDDPDNIVGGRNINFTFVHDYGFTDIRKSEVSITLSAGQTIVDIPYPAYPYRKLVRLKNRMLLYYGEVYVDRNCYEVDDIKRQIILTDLEVVDDRELTIVFFYTGNVGEEGCVAWLPESGYIKLSNKLVNRNFNKEMYLVFVNGMLIHQKYMMDITNNLFKVTKDIKTRYDMNFICGSPLIYELKDMYTRDQDKWSNMIKPLHI